MLACYGHIQLRADCRCGGGSAQSQRLVCGHGERRTVEDDESWDQFPAGLRRGRGVFVGVRHGGPEEPDTVWLGTGENQAQRAIGYGDGMYKSTDAGKTWKNMGLANSEHIGKIWVDARNPNVVWVAAQGPLFSAGRRSRASTRPVTEVRRGRRC